MYSVLFRLQHERPRELVWLSGAKYGRWKDMPDTWRQGLRASLKGKSPVCGRLRERESTSSSVYCSLSNQEFGSQSNGGRVNLVLVESSHLMITHEDQIFVTS